MKSPYTNFISCDVETGGLPNKTKRAFDDIALTEIALVAINSELEIVEEKSWLIKPYKTNLIYDKGAEISTGISKQMCEEKGMDLKDAIKEIVLFLKKYKAGSSLPIIFGHNFIKFDAAFLLNMFAFCKDDLMKYVNAEPEDTLKWARLCWTESTNYKLGTCTENAKITLIDAHRALNDTVATAKLWIYFMKNLRGTFTQSSNADNGIQRKFRDEFVF